MSRPGDIQRDPEAPVRTRRALDSISAILNSLIRSGQIAFDGATDQFMIVPDRRSVVPPVPPIYEDAPDIIIVPGPAGPAGPQGATGPAGSGGGGSGGAQLYFPDLPPETANANDDEFPSGALDGDWTEWDVGAKQTVTVGAYGLNLTHLATSGDSIAGIHRAVPSGDWSLVTKVSLSTAPSQYPFAGMFVAADLSGSPSTAAIRCWGLLILNTGRVHVSVTAFSNYTTFSSTPLDITVEQMDAVYLRVRRASTTLFYDYSTDGLNWLQCLSEAEPYTISRVGLFANNNTGGSTSIGAYFRFWRQTSLTALDQPILGAFSGTSGERGLQGMPGIQGEEGEPGLFVPGPRGSDGVPGSQGVQGVTGPPGLQGEDAPDIVVFPGPQGPQGIQGAVGPTGATGGGLAAAAIIYPDEPDQPGAVPDRPLVPALQNAFGWGSCVAYLGTNQALTSFTANTIAIDTVTQDPDGLFNTGAFSYTPKDTGTYLVGMYCTMSGVVPSSRSIASVYTGSTEVARLMDAECIQVGGTALVPLTAGTAYLFKVFPVPTGHTALAGASQTFVFFRRIF